MFLLENYNLGQTKIIIPTGIMPRLLTEDSLQSKGKCPCFRPRVHIYCSCCGYYGEGRIKLPCSRHIKVDFINDYSHCPMCKAQHSLSEF